MPKWARHHKILRVVAFVGASTLVLGMAGSTGFAVTGQPFPAPSSTSVGTPAVRAQGEGRGADVIPPGPKAIPGRFIVTLQAGVNPDDFAASERGRGNQVDRVFRHAINGYAGVLSPADAGRLAADPRVKRIEPDQTVHLDATQSGPTWGLDRVDERFLPLDGTYTYSTAAAGVKTYVIDTGIRPTHSDFGNRVVAGYDDVGGVSPPASDCNGHGTHVAGTIGGATYGVAKEATLVAVRVLDCSGSGTYSGVIAGIDWVTADHQAGQPAVANMSLGGPASASVDDAVANSVADGVVYAVAAGNSNANACNSSPARAPSALTVAATDNTDTRASFSNYGSCVDLFAPGVSITSDWSSSDTATNTISGTSMATPHVAGVAALTLAGSPGATVDQVNQAMLSNATPGIVTNAGSGTPNRLLYVGSEPVPPPPPPLVANDMFADATVLTGTSGNTSGTNVDATKEPGEPNHAGNAGGASIWYRLTPTTSGTATIDTVGSDFDTLLAVYTGSAVGALTEVASNDDISLFLNVQSRVQFPVTAGVTYNIAVDGWSGASGPATGAVTLNWTIAPSSPPPAAPSLSIADASINEGRRGTRTMTFTVSLSAPTSTTVTVAYATADGTATAGSDYQAKSGTVSIAAGGTSATVKVVVYGDRNPEPNETFTVNLSNPTGGATIGDGTATGTIINDD